ncbi:hypothetical protein HY772_06680 [Candidatus Woesearchaeota archaeon]|nr:hypothetical protein [Candidatus Woesearchaeota archaeon]
MNTMKRVKSGLAMLVISASLEGCSSAPLKPACPKQLVDFDKPPTYETGTISIDQNPSHCNKPTVEMNLFGYNIMCSPEHYFEHDSRIGDLLVWDDVTYSDDNMDGRPDSVYVPRVGELQPLEQQVKLYAETLKMLRKDYIHRLWEKRWK